MAVPPELTRDDLAALVETGRVLASETGLTPLLRVILDGATSLTDSPDAGLFLYDPPRQVLYAAAARGAAADELLAKYGRAGGQGVPVKGSKAGEVFESQVPAVVASVAADPNHFKGVDRDTGHATRSMICVPLSIGRERLGVVQLLNKRSGDYSARDRVLLEYFASQAALAVRRAQQTEELLSQLGLCTGSARPEAFEELLAELNRPARRERMSILFADMRGSTQLWHVVREPEAAQKYIRELLTVLSDAVLARGGVVNKLLGDGLMAYFHGEDGAARAVEAAAAMHREFKPLRERWDAENNQSLAFLDLGVGIATDEVLFGPLGTNRVRDFTVVGTGVILAVHLMDHARDGRHILVDKQTYLAARGVIVTATGPETFELKKPSQSFGHTYARYLVTHVRGPGGPVLTPPVAGSGAFSGTDIRDLCDALAAAFTEATFSIMLRTRLDRDVSRYSGPGSFQTVLYHVVTAAEREGWREKLIAAAVAENPGNAAMRTFLKARGL